MSRHRHRGDRDWRSNPRRGGWDVVRTPFGERLVPRGQGWREAAKWSLWRGLAWLVGLAAFAILALLLHRLTTPHF